MIKKIDTSAASPAGNQGKRGKATKPTKPAKRKSSAVATDLTREADSAVLERLYSVVQSRKGGDPSLSHSARLLSRGTYKIAQKFGEEAVECLIEAVAGRNDHLVGESADVLYHLIVLWVDAGITPEEVWAELRRREGTSGIAEKASRPRPPQSEKENA
ncbi:phosphoribosyl-ATP diphosphatase [Acetobacter peroxydans]|jgi:phosphoribosyl-ATP pyrophosphohydrolase|uniref:phosphoribosyl-ATP diphosphatase n=1 Tax=Acetobacter peroxydans TaxID=104098 RepID=UPI0023525E30|nr:phosphoribosyl-ATP diphosphatase [Acetobacter peroxydans]MCH4143391.1 phosphoribosyl-ATP diphosphatase [Acetobacter peroxydans]MCI1393976.1 phosphoribosyl-ATP diphosphatase [Acetobacter peroxydans]MCI1411750.1 phosphoribosyl-ATP diphosphatase [Acetobacter peroxydans]MCI1440758.1 phosphoribosyl-ATP diphosphatase [Acetobacter peroxydans]MCI1567209.1 phosphoribosyl-ATP diphosphatase [Acetobacter peroxydans]